MNFHLLLKYESFTKLFSYVPNSSYKMENNVELSNHCINNYYIFHILTEMAGSHRSKRTRKEENKF